MSLRHLQARYEDVCSFGVRIWLGFVGIPKSVLVAQAQGKFQAVRSVFGEKLFNISYTLK